MIRRAVLVLALVLTATLVWSQSEAGVMVTTPGPSAGRPNHSDNEVGPDATRITGSISGTVLSLDGHPLSEVHVELHALQLGTVLGSVYSNATGGFELNNVPAGEYELVAQSGTSESRERVEVQSLKTFVNLTMAGAVQNGAGAGATVSVANMHVPDKARNLYHKAQEAFQKNKLDQARSETDKALKIYPNYAEALVLRGLVDLQEGKLEDGRAELERAVDSDANDGMAYVALGSVYNALHRSDDALRVLNRSLSLVPNAWQAYFERARALVSKKIFAPALQDLEKARQLSSNDFPLMHLIKANAFLGLQDYPNAKTELQAYLDRVPQGSNADQARHVLEQMKNLTAANTRK